MTRYRAVVQRLGKLFPLIALSLIGFGFGLRWALTFDGYHEFNAAMMKITGGLVVAIFWALANAYRVHLWVLEPGGLRIRERPRIPLTGLPRRALIPYGDISALQQSGSGDKRTLQVTARDGRQFVIDQALVNDPQSRFLMSDPAAALDDLEQAIRAQAAQAGNALAATSLGLSYFQTRAGLSVLAILFILTIPLAGLTIWAVWEGARPQMSTRVNHEAFLLLLLAPCLFGWLFLSKLRSRRAVLKASAAPSPPAHTGAAP